MDYSKLKSKRQKYLEIALVLALLIIVIIAAVLYTTPKTETETEVEEVEKEPLWKNGWLQLFVLGAILLYLYTRKKEVKHLQNFEIIKLIADTIYQEKGLYLDTSLENVTVKKGGADEVYVEFDSNKRTFLFEQGVGITEIHNGKTITDVIDEKSKDVIQMKLAEQGIARKKIMEDMERLGLTGEEV